MAAIEMAHKVPMFLSFSNVCTSVEDRKILQNVSGKVKPGEIMAIMGPSGAGKSTLLNVMSGRLKPDSGEVCINGKKLTKQLKRKICYVLQEDIFFSHLTLKETLTYSAMLRLPDTMSRKEKQEKVEEIVDTLDIRKCLDTVIGSAEVRGLSGGEKKRANVGCELITDPSLIFLDEPTSGLDSSNAFNLMSTLKNIAVVKNKTVVASIHQPSSQVFFMFDKLLLLCNGQIAYFGSPSEVLDFFDEIQLPCEPHYNPADFILEKVNADKDLQDRIVQYWSKRPKKRKKSQGLAVVHPMQRPEIEDNNKDVDDKTMVENDLVEGEDENPQTDQDKPQDNFPMEEPFIVWQKRGQNEENEGLIYSKHRKRQDNHNKRSSKSDLNKSPSKLRNSVASIVNAQDSSNAKVTVISIGKKLGNLDKGYKTLDIRDDEEESGDEEVEEQDYGHISTTWVTSFWTQFTVLLERNFKQAKPEILSKLNNIQTIVLAFIVGVIWFRIPYEEERIRDRYAMLFFIVTYWGFSPLMMSLLAFPTEKLVINKERSSGYYRLSAYYLAKTVSELPLVVFQPTVFMIMVYWATGLNNSVAFLSTLFAVLSSSVAAQSIGFFLGALGMDFKKTLLFASLFMLSCMLLGGFYQQNIPVWLSWVQYVSFITYTFNAVTMSEFETSPPFSCKEVASSYEVCQTNGTAVIQGTDVLRQLNMTSSYAFNVSALLAIMFVFRIIAYLILRYIRKPS